MQFKIPQLIPTDKDKFIEFWARRYSYRSDEYTELYNENIGQALNDERVRKLFRWKNGTNISKGKSKSVEIYVAELNKSPKIDSLEKGKEYIANLNGGAVWDIFWIHCLNNKLFPIFDQHASRAMSDMNELNLDDLKSYSRSEQINIYFNHYIPFISKIGGDMRLLDKALFAYGKELKTGLFSI